MHWCRDAGGPGLSLMRAGPHPDWPGRPGLRLMPPSPTLARDLSGPLSRPQARRNLKI